MASLVSKASNPICLFAKTEMQKSMETASFHFALKQTDQHSALCILSSLQ